MININWDAKFEIGQPRIDHQHRVFVDLIIHASREMERGMSREWILRYLQEVRKFAEFHFFSEESMMLDAGYPDYEQHRREHQMLLSTLEEQVFAFRNERVSLQQIVDFLYEWYALHTTQSDVKIARYLAKSG